MGLEPFSEEAVENAPDALGEMLNVICGQYLTAQFGTSPVFNLSIPNCQPINSETWSHLHGHLESAAILIDDEPAMVLASEEEVEL